MRGLEGAIPGVKRAVTSAVRPQMVAEAAAGPTARAMPEAAKAAGVVGGAVESSVRPVEGVLLNTANEAGGIQATLERISEGNFAPVKIPRESVFKESGEGTGIKVENFGNPIYQSMKDEAATRANQQIGDESVAGHEMNDSTRLQIRENELDHAALQFATQHTEEARAMASSDPRLQKAVELINKRKAETEGNEESDQAANKDKKGAAGDAKGERQDQKDLSQNELERLRADMDTMAEELLSLRAENKQLIESLATFKQEMIQTVKTLKDAMEETDPKERASLLAIIAEMLVRMAVASIIEMPKVVGDQVKQQL